MSKVFILSFLKQLILIVLLFFAPIKGIILLVGLMIAMDTVSGILKAKKLGVPITSRRASHIVSKFVLYESSVLLFYCIEYFILGDFIALLISTKFVLTKLVAMTLIGIELKSINENMITLIGYSMFKKFKEMLLRAKDTALEIKEFKKEIEKKD